MRPVAGLTRLVLVFFAVLSLWAGGPGFRSEAQLDQHYRKHGGEFGHISKQEYLRLAQQLRDTPPGGPILEAVRRDGVITKFDKRNGHFGAYNRDGTIRTFFIPVQGVRYFERQAKRPRASLYLPRFADTVTNGSFEVSFGSPRGRAEALRGLKPAPRGGWQGHGARPRGRGCRV